MPQRKNDRSQLILNFIKDNPDCTYQMIGDYLGVSRQRVLQLFDIYEIQRLKPKSKQILSGRYSKRKKVNIVKNDEEIKKEQKMIDDIIDNLKSENIFNSSYDKWRI